MCYNYIEVFGESLIIELLDLSFDIKYEDFYNFITKIYNKIDDIKYDTKIQENQNKYVIYKFNRPPKKFNPLQFINKKKC